MKKQKTSYSEFELIKKIKKLFPEKKNIFKAIGDDCAVIKKFNNYNLYTVDNMVEGVHFDISIGMDYKSIGYKAIVRSISDIIAMGGTPEFYLLNLLIPPKFKNTYIDQILMGIKEASLKYNVAIIGGDISTCKTLAISVSAIGKMKDNPIFRGGAKVGDYIYYTGKIGMASAGLHILKKHIRDKALSCYVEKFLRPNLRKDFASMLAKERLINSMIDISDGFLGDLLHILEESECGALIYENFLKENSSETLKKFFSNREIDSFILNGGDDYELLFTANKDNKVKINSLAKKLKVPLAIAGEIIPKGLYLERDNKRIKISSLSYEHLT